MILLVAAITPVIIFLYIIYKKDTEKEPIGLLIKCFIGGMLSLIPALIFGTGFEIFNSFYSPVITSFYKAFFVAAISEEIAKFIILYYIVWKSKEFDQHYDGIICAVFVSLGFALVENIMYVFESGMEVAILRAVTAIPGHGFFGVAMGYFFALAKFSDRQFRVRNIFLCLFIPILLHGIYDFVLMYMSTPEIGGFEAVCLVIVLTFVIIFLWRYGIGRIKDHILRDKIDNEL